MNTSEKFDYQGVSACMGSIDTYAKDARDALNNGTRAIEATIGSAGTGLSGNSANQIASKWSELTASFEAFSNYVNGTLEKMSAAAKQNQQFESESGSLFTGTTSN